MEWSAKQYVSFEDERTRPVRDLLSVIPEINARAVIDIGCGPGNSTELLAARFPTALVSALDSSLDMLEAARKRLPKVHFDLIDIAEWNDTGPFDVILANAVLQWLPNHSVLLPAILTRLNPGGCLAIQMPDNLAEPAYQLMCDIATHGPWANKLANSAKVRAPGYSVDWYFEKLSSHCNKLDIWRTTYYHPLTGGAEAIVEWFKGSGLMPFLHPLNEDERVEYLDRYTKAIAGAYPALANGKVLLPFPRLFILAIR